MLPLCLPTLVPAQAQAERIEGYYRSLLHSGSSITRQVTARDDGADAACLREIFGRDADVEVSNADREE